MTARLAASLDALRERLSALPPDRQDAVADELLAHDWAAPDGDDSEAAFGGPWPRPTPPAAPADAAALAAYEDELRAWRQYHTWPGADAAGSGR